jgi:peptidoglycan/xylan/chitin deacetylase (PgdA/CDA1 family)
MKHFFAVFFLMGILPTTGCAADRPSDRPAPLAVSTPGLPIINSTASSQGGPAKTQTPLPQSKPSAPKVTYTAVDVRAPYVALTFDDGPKEGLTPKLLDLLKARRVKATFFVLGQCVANHPDIARRIVAEGHEIANHSWSHPLFTKLSDVAVRSQLRRTHDLVRKTTGVEMRNMRPPYGGITNRQKNWIYAEFGYPTILWSVDPLDWKNRNARLVTQRLVAGAHPGAILLAHDIHASTVAAMPGTLDALLARGFRFVTVSELLELEEQVPPSQAAASESPMADASR